MRRRAFLSLACLPLALAACSGGGDDDDDGPDYVETGRVEVTLLVPPAGAGQDPFAGASGLRVIVQDSAGNVIVQEDFDADDPLEIQDLEVGDQRVIVLEGRDTVGTVISRGRTLPIDIVESPTPVETTLYFSRVGVFSTVYGSPAARTGAATWTFSDGRVLVAGGLDGAGNALASAEIFDWETDSVLPAGSMTSALAFAAVAPLGNDTILLAGGITINAGAPSAAAMVYEHTAGGVGTWTAAPAMPAARREHCAVELGAGRAFVAGGASTNAVDGPPLQSTLVFAWDGSAGSWTLGPNLDDPRMGAICLDAPGDVAVIAGGFHDNQGGGGPMNDFSREFDVFTWTGSMVQSNVGNNGVALRRGWAGVLRTASNQWLVWGGEAGSGGVHTVLDDVEEWTWNGTSVSMTTLADFPIAQRGGAAGVLAGGDILLLGGNTALYPATTPAGTATIYDPVADSFTPLASGPGPTLGGTAAPLPDGTSLVVIDGAVLRYNP